MRSLILPALALASLFGPTAAALADDKEEGNEVRKVVETFLKNQGSPTRCENNTALCFENAVFVVTHKKDTKMDGPHTIKQLNAYIKSVLKADQTITIDSVTVDLKANTDLAVAFATLQVDETAVSAIYTLAKRDGKWKVMSITQHNR
jgi:hypothetical protein